MGECKGKRAYVTNPACCAQHNGTKYEMNTITRTHVIEWVAHPNIRTGYEMRTQITQLSVKNVWQFVCAM